MTSRGIKSKYDRKVLETIDVIGCYFIDLFYNDLFLKAKHAFNTGHSKSLTDTYRSHIIWFMRGIADKPKNYIEVMKKLLEYYNNATRTITSTLNELENKILSQFIPPEYYQDFTNANKEQVLHDIIIKAVNQLGEVALETSMLGRIIDDHMNQGNVQLLQEKLTDIFISLREEYYSKFVNEISKTNGNKTVSRDQFKKLKAEYAEELKRRISAESERDRAVQLLQVSLKKISELEEALSGSSQGDNYQGNFQSNNRVTRELTTPVPKEQTPVLIKTVRTPVQSPLRLQSKSPMRVAPTSDTADTGLKLSDLTLGITNKRGKKTKKSEDMHVNEPLDVFANTESLRTHSVQSAPDANEESGDSKESEESGDTSESEDSEELHKRQKKALLESRKQVAEKKTRGGKKSSGVEKASSEFSLGLDDDPGFGDN